jgi:hypothetical protein
MNKKKIFKIVAVLLLYILLLYTGVLRAQITQQQTLGAPHTQVTNRGFFDSDSAIHITPDTIRSARVGSIAVIGTQFWVQALNGVDSSWQPAFVKAANGLTDSAGTILLGGVLEKPTTIVAEQKGLFIRGAVDSPSSTALLSIGNSTVDRNGFNPPLVISDTAHYVGDNSPFISMCTADVAHQNGFLFLNFQDIPDSVIPNMRCMNPTTTREALGLDLMGASRCRLCSSLNIFTYGSSDNQNSPTSGASLMAIHNGPFNTTTNPALGFTAFLLDSNTNLLLGPAEDTLLGSGFPSYAFPNAHIDIKDNGNKMALHVEGATGVSKFEGPVLFPQFTTVEKLALTPLTEGEQVYDITLHQMSYWNGTTWINF